MATLDYTAFAARFPEFATTDAPTQARIEAAIALAKKQVGATAWDDLYDDGVLLLAAHQYALAKRATTAGGSGAAATGGITAISTGSMSISYASPSSGADGSGALLTTPYGQQFSELRRLVGAVGVTI